jgi:hypothetical protein
MKRKDGGLTPPCRDLDDDVALALVARQQLDAELLLSLLHLELRHSVRRARGLGRPARAATGPPGFAHGPQLAVVGHDRRVCACSARGLAARVGATSGRNHSASIREAPFDLVETRLEVMYLVLDAAARVAG